MDKKHLIRLIIPLIAIFGIALLFTITKDDHWHNEEVLT